MYLTGYKVILVLCIIAAFSIKGTLTIKTPIVNDYFELKAFKDFLDYNHLKHAIIIYSLSSASLSAPTKDCVKVKKENFLNSALLQHLTENYRLQFFNTLSKNKFENLFHFQSPRVGVFMQHSFHDMAKENILQLASQQEKFNSSLAWFIVMEDNENYRENIKKAFGNLNIMLNADVTVAFSVEKYSLKLYDIYKICHDCNFSLKIEFKGNWSEREGLQILKEFRYGIVVRRNNLNDSFLSGATVIQNKSPDLNLTNEEYLNDNQHHMEVDTMQRRTYQLVRYMEPLYNISLNLHFTDSWGTNVNGKYTGVVGLLIDGKAEISLCPLRFVSERMKLVRYSPNTQTEKIYFLFRHPKRTSIRNIFFEPLNDIVWWCVLILIVITILLLFIHVHTEYQLYWKIKRHQRATAGGVGDLVIGNNTHHEYVKHSGMVKEKSFDFIAFCIMETILMQGPEPDLFYYNSTRLSILSLSVFSILLMQFYGAFIVSSLLSEAPRTITNLPALYNSSLEIGMENVSYNYEVFINTTNQLIQNTFKYRICKNRRKNIISVEEGAKRIGKGNFAFNVAVDRAYRLLKTFLTESEFCELQEIVFTPPVTFATALGIRKSSPYHEYVVAAVQKFHESSLMQYNDKKWEVDKIDCSFIKNTEMQVDLDHFASALAFLAFALFASFLVFLTELAYKYLSRFRKGLNIKTKICRSINIK